MTGAQRAEKELYISQSWFFEYFTDLTASFVRAISSKHRNELKNTYIDKAVLRNIYDLAVKSIDFHLELDEVVHYKESAHLCFWFSKLKPIFLISNDSTFKWLARLKGEEGCFVNKGISVPLGIERDDLKKILIPFMFNETVGLHVSAAVIGLIETEIETGIKMAEANKDVNSDLYKRFIAAQDKIMKKSPLSRPDINNKLVYSLRYHNGSARALATTFESIMIQPKQLFDISTDGY